MRLDTGNLAGGFSAARARLVLACGLLLLCAAPAAVAQSDADAVTAKRRIEAAFLYKFSTYVDWPDGAFATAEAPIVFGVEGDDLLADELTQTVSTRKVAQRPLVVRKVKKGTLSPGVHVLFAADIDDDWLLAGAAQSQPTLVVTDRQGALSHGSTINFVVVDEHVRFEISLIDADRRDLKLSARLLEVAKNVVREKP